MPLLKIVLICCVEETPWYIEWPSSPCLRELTSSHAMLLNNYIAQGGINLSSSHAMLLNNYIAQGG